MDLTAAIDSPAARHWREALASWALPDDILAQAPTSPWSHDPASFVVDDTLDPDTTASRIARSLLADSSGVVLDIGCGGGRASIPLVPDATELIGVDENIDMLTGFSRTCEGLGITYRTIQGRWPAVAPETPVADVVVCHHVFYNVADLVPFAAALTDHARRGVVVVLPDRHPQSPWNEAWKHFWNLERPTHPTVEDAMAVLDAMGLEAQRVDAPRGALARSTSDPSAMVASLRRRLCLEASRDPDIADYLRDHRPQFTDEVAVISWTPDRHR
jgi:SAM-dependent methyltransferase